MSSPHHAPQSSSTSGQTTNSPSTAHGKPATSSHPPPNAPDPTLTTSSSKDAQGSLPPTPPASTPELSNLKISLRSALRQFPDFPAPGILFEDILPIFANPTLHEGLLRALEIHVGSAKPDVIVGLDARGFLFGPGLALRLGAKFVPVRKRGKLPGPTVQAKYMKEYGEDVFEMQADGIGAGERVIVVDDIIATGGSAAAAGSLVKQLGGELLEYIFILELDFLKGRDKLDAPVYTLLSSQEEKMA
ncbi:adenine phosphoribosyltransferase 1 [Trichodelitschia bisporula]|uniref:adenine phosphoribosyltransferase n=1 Tax=Trichodelitschia bisporula TaxID=703511 RepID=A0A6G1I7E4_9PEZI|nr:adenine phosphoribosyltransferase 1 [Trichodelitschia bisporula]